ncbi:MAG TPA: acyl-CoA-binding protein [Flavobacterium sp.]|nr:acyl-CoA-binding protein [Flavobacterium sp.]
MDDKELEMRFRDAVDVAYNLPEGSLAPDVQLRLYAFYKQATHGAPDYRPASESNLRTAFKANAWLQISYLSPEDAMRHYIEMVDEIIKNREE